MVTASCSRYCKSADFSNGPFWVAVIPFTQRRSHTAGLARELKEATVRVSGCEIIAVYGDGEVSGARG
jgi:hypothetical protein